MVEKCTHCNEEFVVKTWKKYYVYKLREVGRSSYSYFCSYSCMQSDKRENPKKYSKRR